MKFTIQTIAALFLVTVTSVSAAPAGSQRPNCPSGSASLPGTRPGTWTCVNLMARDEQPKHTPKERALFRAQRHNATTEEIDFLNSVPDDTFQKMADDGKKLGQARAALWSKTVPDMAALPTPETREPGDRPEHTGAPRPAGQKPSRKDKFIKWAEKKENVSADVLAKLQSTPDSVFDDLRKGSMKDRFVKEAELMENTDMANFFKNEVPQNVFDDIESLRTKLITAHKDMKARKQPTDL
ncbi:hypothetical protein ABW20_dc0103499 [Dactylellina cionopaga]|nr:hypothetical protein ABW20_dc0103499 [Dactylellina cionopaga]